MSPVQKARVIETLKYVLIGLENGRLQPLQGSKADLDFNGKTLARFTMDLQFIEPERAAVTDVVSRPPSAPATEATSL